jgi:hypothetical protein
MTLFYGSFKVRLLLINALKSCFSVRLLTSQKIKIHKSYKDDLENHVNILSECTSAIANDIAHRISLTSNVGHYSALDESGS